MATFFIDLDGTIFEHGTNFLLDGASEFLDKINDDDHDIIFTTRRGDEEFEGHKIFGKQNTIDALKTLGLVYKDILFNLSSPRIVVNDSGCGSVDIDPQKPLYPDLKELL